MAEQFGEVYEGKFVESSEVRLIKPWILFLAAVVSLAGRISVSQCPMQVASKISAIDNPLSGARCKARRKRQRKKRLSGTEYQEVNDVQSWVGIRAAVP